MSIEDRVKSLENWRDNIIAACVGAPTITPQPTKTAPPIPNLKDETLDNITWETNGNIKLKTYLEDKDLFERINKDLFANGYKYVSAGRNTHWEKAT